MAYATQSDLVPLRMSQKDLIELTDDGMSIVAPVSATSGDVTSVTFTFGSATTIDPSTDLTITAGAATTAAPAVAPNTSVATYAAALIAALTAAGISGVTVTQTGNTIVVSGAGFSVAGDVVQDGITNEVNTSIVNAALEEASGRVDSYCRARYATPLQQSDDVTSLTVDIAVYLLFSRRRETRMNETVQERYQQAMAFLKDISSSKASLDQPATATPQTSLAGPKISEKDRHLRFRDRDIEGFV